MAWGTYFSHFLIESIFHRGTTLDELNQANSLLFPVCSPSGGIGKEEDLYKHDLQTFFRQIPIHFHHYTHKLLGFGIHYFKCIDSKKCYLKKAVFSTHRPSDRLIFCI